MKEADEKPKKLAKPKVAQKADKPKKPKTPPKGTGDNSVNKPLVKIFDDYAQLDKSKKEIAKAQRDLRAKAKESHGVQSNVFNHQVKLRKMASDVRVQFEQGINDLNEQLGYQFTLGLIEAEKTENVDQGDPTLPVGDIDTSHLDEGEDQEPGFGDE